MRHRKTYHFFDGIAIAHFICWIGATYSLNGFASEEHFYHIETHFSSKWWRWFKELFTAS